MKCCLLITIQFWLHQQSIACINKLLSLFHCKSESTFRKVTTVCTKIFTSVPWLLTLTRTHHFSDHHDVRSSLLVNSQNIQESHVPEDDIETIHRPPGDEGFTSGQPQAKADKEGHNGQKVGHIKIVTKPHLYLLAYFACFRHKHLEKKRDGG